MKTNHLIGLALAVMAALAVGVLARSWLPVGTGTSDISGSSVLTATGAVRHEARGDEVAGEGRMTASAGGTVGGDDLGAAPVPETELPGDEVWVDHTVREVPDGPVSWYSLRYPESWQPYWEAAKGYQSFTVLRPRGSYLAPSPVMVQVASTEGDVDFDLVLPVRREMSLLSETPTTIADIETTILEKGMDDGADGTYARVYDADLASGGMRYRIRWAVNAGDEDEFERLKADADQVVASLQFLPDTLASSVPEDGWEETRVAVPAGAGAAAGQGDPTAVAKYRLRHPPGWTVAATDDGGLDASGMAGEAGPIEVRVQPTGERSNGDGSIQEYPGTPDRPFGYVTLSQPVFEATASGERQTFRIAVNNEILVITVDLPVGPGDPDHLLLDQVAWRVLNLSGLQPSDDYVEAYP
jgi:hypothetical protein